MPKVTGCKLSPAQIRILKALESRPMNRAELEDAVGFSVNVGSLGYLTSKPLGSNSSSFDDSESLIGQGLVKAAIDIDRDCVMVSLTKEGIKAAKTYSINDRISQSERIPPAVLDPAVLKIKTLRAYGFEQYTPADLQLIRGACGKTYAHVSDDSLQRQIQARRKVGAYAKPFDPRHPSWYSEYIQGSHVQSLYQSLLNELGGCSMNQEHEEPEEGFAVIHRRFINQEGENVLWQETPADVLLLCPECHKRCLKSLPSIPVQDLR